jgi:hypothetical protein
MAEMATAKTTAMIAFIVMDCVSGSQYHDGKERMCEECERGKRKKKRKK